MVQRADTGCSRGVARLSAGVKDATKEMFFKINIFERSKIAAVLRLALRGAVCVRSSCADDTLSGKDPPTIENEEGNLRTPYKRHCTTTTTRALCISQTTHLKVLSAFHALSIRRDPTVSFGEVPRETRGAGVLPDDSNLKIIVHGCDKNVAENTQEDGGLAGVHLFHRPPSRLLANNTRSILCVVPCTYDVGGRSHIVRPISVGRATRRSRALLCSAVRTFAYYIWIYIYIPYRCRCSSGTGCTWARELPGPRTSPRGTTDSCRRARLASRHQASRTGGGCPGDTAHTPRFRWGGG